MSEMNEMAKLGVLEKKLDGICDKNNLVHKFRYDKYPITLTIRPAGGMEEQMTMLEKAADDGNYTSPDAYLMFAYQDGDLIYRTTKTFTISDTLFAKLKNIFKKMHTYYCQHVHRTNVERGLQLPNIEVIDDDDLPEDPESVDDYDDDEETWRT